jgi:hypothetical protein
MIIKVLEDNCTQLREELRKVDSKCFVTHDNVGTLEVYGDLLLKPYVPKKYYGWPVTFQEFDGEQIDLDLEITI